MSNSFSETIFEHFIHFLFILQLAINCVNEYYWELAFGGPHQLAFVTQFLRPFLLVVRVIIVQVKD